jgi:penicillin G amidase
MKLWPVIRALLGAVFTVGLTWALNTKLGPAPPMGPFLSPFTGFWQNMETGALATETEELRIPGLKAPVQVVFDDRRVPHVFAQNDADLYLAQGYLTARDRLWQMEFQTRVAAGRVSEIVGEKALALDRYQRRIGMVVAAERAAREMLADSLTRPAVLAYCAGVNARIQELTPGTLPFEYKLLDYRPEPWTPLHCGLLLKLMALDLTGKSDDYRMSNVRQKLGAAATADLFPDYPTKEDPIIPVGTPLDFQPNPVPVKTRVSFEKPTSTLRPATKPTRSPASQASVPTASGYAAVSAFERTPEEQAAIGSNNWAVSGQRSASGYPILCNDPHLSLNLPSLWYQMQLSAPGYNACGATLPGAPAIISGFNQQVAWGVTNVGADVLDFYQITFIDIARTRYRWGNEERKAELKIERIKVRGKADVLDTVRWTHMGPIVRDRLSDVPFKDQAPPGCAMRWTAHEPSNELRAFCDLNRARSYDDYVRALHHYACPAQNFVFASLRQDIAIWANGRFPVRYEQEGKFILDAEDLGLNWFAWIPQAHNPHVRNPARGFVSSANQSSAGPEYPYYLGWEYANYARGHRINEVLAADSHATPETMRALQNDVVGVNARDLLPTLLAIPPAATQRPAEQAARKLLNDWDYRYAANTPQPAIWEVWYGLLQDAIWADELGSDTKKDPTSLPLRYPNRDRTLRLLTQANDTARWFDDITTPNRRETRPELVQRSFRLAIDSLTKHLGPDPMQWRWWQQKSTDIKHVALLPGFGFDDVECGGGAGIVNATTERTGPSWRMVVALDPKRPQAWGVYPGGQSGNPGSPFYADQLEFWRTGQLYPILYLLSPDETSPRIAGRARLRSTAE